MHSTKLFLFRSFMSQSRCLYGIFPHKFTPNEYSSVLVKDLNRVLSSSIACCALDFNVTWLGLNEYRHFRNVHRVSIFCVVKYFMAIVMVTMDEEDRVLSAERRRIRAYCQTTVEYVQTFFSMRITIFQWDIKK